MTTRIALQLISAYNSSTNWPFSIHTVWGEVFNNQPFPTRSQPSFDNVIQIPDYDTAKKLLFDAAVEHLVKKLDR